MNHGPPNTSNHLENLSTNDLLQLQVAGAGHRLGQGTAYTANPALIGAS